MLVVLGALGAACSRGGAPLPSPAPGAARAEPESPPPIDRVTPLPSPLPDVVARVNGQPIYLLQVVGLARESLQDSKDREKDKPGALRQAMHQYVVRELLLQEAQARKISADPRRLEETYNDLRVKYRDDKDWAELLAQQGHTPQSFKEDLRVQQTVQALVTEESLKVQVTDDEARAYLAANPDAFGLGERLTVAHIQFLVPARAIPPQRAHARFQAELAMTRIRKGEEFAKVAKDMSEDQASRAQGGRVPEFSRGEREKRFEDAAFALEAGEVSEVVETKNGFEIIKLLERRPVPVLFEQVREPLEERLLQQKRQASLQSLVNSLRAKARIETFI
jgi:peptidyl-prolyl cis-trans isomerase C